MKIYLAGCQLLKNELSSGIIKPEEFYCLESYYSMQDWFMSYMNRFKDFLLDSGAFTFLHSSKRCDWDKYTEEYAEFINAYNIAKFFELDIDSIVGLKEVERLRAKLERLTGKQSIPVWHFSRGKEYFTRMVQEYKYVAFGGLAIHELPMQKFELMMPYFIKTAHKYDCKIHGLGYTHTTKLSQFHFNSVDSSSWVNAGRYGEVFQFQNNKIVRHASVINGVKIKRIKDVEAVKFHNFKEWVKFQQYANKNL